MSWARNQKLCFLQKMINFLIWILSWIYLPVGLERTKRKMENKRLWQLQRGMVSNFQE
jgi:hypothetical protein